MSPNSGLENSALKVLLHISIIMCWQLQPWSGSIWSTLSINTLTWILCVRLSVTDVTSLPQRVLWEQGYNVYRNAYAGNESPSWAPTWHGGFIAPYPQLQEGYEGGTVDTRASKDCTIDKPDFIDRKLPRWGWGISVLIFLERQTVISKLWSTSVLIFIAGM